MEKTVLLFIESNTSGTGYLFLENALKNHMCPILFTANPELYKIPYNGITIEKVNTNDINSILDSCYNLYRNNIKISGVLSTSDYYVYTASIIAKTLGLPGASPFAIRDCRDKYVQRKLMQQHGMPTPKYLYINNIEEFRQLDKQIEFPVIIKPIDGSGSFGVSLCKTESELIEKLEQILNRKYNERGLPVNSSALIEEYIDGDEYSVEMIGMQILGITKKYLGDLPYFVEINAQIL